MLLLSSMTLKSGGEAGIDNGPRFLSSSPFKYFILALMLWYYTLAIFIGVNVICIRICHTCLCKMPLNVLQVLNGPNLN